MVCMVFYKLEPTGTNILLNEKSLSSWYGAGVPAIPPMALYSTSILRRVLSHARWRWVHNALPYAGRRLAHRSRLLWCGVSCVERLGGIWVGITQAASHNVSQEVKINQIRNYICFVQMTSINSDSARIYVCFLLSGNHRLNFKTF